MHINFALLMNHVGCLAYLKRSSALAVLAVVVRHKEFTDLIYYKKNMSEHPSELVLLC